MRVLLSIKPQFADRIFEGTKKFEFRKAAFKNVNVRTVVVYVTSPVSKIVGEFDLTDVFCEEPSLLWSRTQKFAGITEDFFLEYFAGREKGVALAIGEVRRYPTPINPSSLIKNFTAPQSYMYVDDELQPVKRNQDQLALAI
jgi:predicted transcriptional regulator